MTCTTPNGRTGCTGYVAVEKVVVVGDITAVGADTTGGDVVPLAHIVTVVRIEVVDAAADPLNFVVSVDESVHAAEKGSLSASRIIGSLVE